MRGREVAATAPSRHVGALVLRPRCHPIRRHFGAWSCRHGAAPPRAFSRRSSALFGTRSSPLRSRPCAPSGKVLRAPLLSGVRTRSGLFLRDIWWGPRPEGPQPGAVLLRMANRARPRLIPPRERPPDLGMIERALAAAHRPPSHEIESAPLVIGMARLTCASDHAATRVKPAPRQDLRRQILMLVTAEALRAVHVWGSTHVAVIAVGRIVERVVTGGERAG